MKLAKLMLFALGICICTSSYAGYSPKLNIKPGKLLTEYQITSVNSALQEKMCCKRLDQYNDGTATIDQVNRACHESWEEDDTMDSLEMLYAIVSCVEYNRQQTQAEIIDNMQ